MSDLKKSARELGAKAAFGAARDAAERALGDALISDEERAVRKAEEAERAKRRRRKRLVLAVLGVVIVLGVIGLAFRYWHWFLLLGLLGLVALYGRHRWRKYRASSQQRVPELPAKEQQPAHKLPPALPEPHVADAPGPSIEDELAALKARVKK